MARYQLTRLPEVHYLSKDVEVGFVVNGSALEPWGLRDQNVMVGDVHIQGIYPTGALLPNGDLVQLFRQCQDPIAGYYNYLVYARRPAATSCQHNEVLVATDRGNAWLDLPNYVNAKASLRPLHQGWVHTPSHTLTMWLYRHIPRLVSTAELRTLMELFADELWRPGVALREAYNEPASPRGSVLRVVSEYLDYEDLALYFYGLYERIYADLQPLPRAAAGQAAAFPAAQPAPGAAAVRCGSAPGRGCGRAGGDARDAQLQGTGRGDAGWCARPGIGVAGRGDRSCRVRVSFRSATASGVIR